MTKLWGGWDRPPPISPVPTALSKDESCFPYLCRNYTTQLFLGSWNSYIRTKFVASLVQIWNLLLFLRLFVHRCHVPWLVINIYRSIYRPSGTFSNEVGTSLSVGRNLPPWWIYLQKVSVEESPLSPYAPPGLNLLVWNCSLGCLPSQ